MEIGLFIPCYTDQLYPQVDIATLELNEYLVDVLQLNELDGHFPHRISLHESCHGLRGLPLASSSEKMVEGFSKSP